MKEKSSKLFKELLFYGIVVGVGFHLHHQIAGGNTDVADTQPKIIDVPTQKTDSVSVKFNNLKQIKPRVEKTR